VTRRSAQTSCPATRPGAVRVRRLAGRFLSLLVAVVLALSAGLGSGAAFAHWASSGTGVGSATAAAPRAVTLVAATGTVTNKLVPGGTADLLVGLINPNSFPVTVTGVSQTGAVVGPGGGCMVTGVTVPTQVGLTITVASGASVTLHIPSGAAMSAASDSDCQGASFQIPVMVTVRS
jgi:hypothetical protein